MKKFALLLLSLTSLQAALPPLAQSSREIKAIVEDARLFQSLGGQETISQIVRIEGGYEVYTQSQAIQVFVHYLPPVNKGPIPFELQFSSPVSVN
jgi:hypothetical protein